MLIKLAKFFNVITDYLIGLYSDNVIDVTGLTNSEITHIKLLVDDLKTSPKEWQLQIIIFQVLVLGTIHVGYLCKTILGYMIRELNKSSFVKQITSKLSRSGQNLIFF